MIVLFPGWIGTRLSLVPLQRALERRLGREVVRGDIGLGIGCIGASAQRAMDQIEVLAPPDRLDVIGHSMGGLVATFALKRLDRGRRIRTVVTLGTPHRGAPAVSAMPWPASWISQAILQMSPASAFLRELHATPVPVDSRLVSIAALQDGIVPTLYARLARRPRQCNRDVRCGSHLGLLFSSAALDAIVRALGTPTVAAVRRPCPDRAPALAQLH